jgi:phosphoglycerol transferase MdoB-like AlkP superfamily enzyme
LTKLITSLHKPAPIIIGFYLKIFGYFLILFTIGRLLFYFGLTQFGAKPAFFEILKACKEAFYLDFATICYATLLPTLLFSIYQITSKSIFYALCRLILWIFSLLWALITIPEILVYREWKTKLSIQTVLHLTHIDEVFKTASPKELIIFLISIGLAILSIRFLLNVFFKKSTNTSKSNFTSPTIVCLTLLTASVIGLRGGLQPIPIQVSDACYSNNNMYNDVAINPLFSFLANVRNYVNNETNNPFNNISIAQAQTISDSLMVAAKATPQNMEKLWSDSISKPNLVIILMESVSAHCSKAFGGDNFMPNLDAMSKDGLSFMQCYPSGHLSDQGNASILSGYPASPNVGVLMMPNKSATLPRLNTDLKSIGYQSKYYFGGQLTYGNIKQYLVQGDFDEVWDEKNINSKNYKLQRLGINDVDMSQVFLDGINKSKQPFLNCWFTISSHNPYDIPIPHQALTQSENAYTNTVKYTDSALHLFFENAKKQHWYKNTLFVLVSDHSHSSHKNKGIVEADYHRIPLLFYGEVLSNKWRGQKINYTVSQLDIVYTLLESLNMQIQMKQYKFSKSLLNTSTHFAPYTYFNGAGIVYDSSAICYDLRNLQKPAFELNSSAKLRHLSKAISAWNYEDYRKR